MTKELLRLLPKLPRLRARISKRSTRYYFDAGGKPRHWIPLGTDEKIVRKRYDELIAGPAPGTVDAMLSEAIAAMHDKVRPGTLANYVGYRKHLAAVFVDPPETITQRDVLHYLVMCPRKSFRNEISLLSAGFVHWMNTGRLTFNPCFGVRCKRPASKRKRLLSPAELDTIIGAADERLAVAIEFGFATGLRIGDLCALRWPDLAGVVETQKTGARQAFETCDALTILADRAKALQARVASLYVLCDRRGRRWKVGTLRDRWNHAVARAKVIDAHFHDLRAAGATEVERRGGNAQTFLGHTDARTTMLYLRGLRINVVRPLARKG